MAGSQRYIAAVSSYPSIHSLQERTPCKAGRASRSLIDGLSVALRGIEVAIRTRFQIDCLTWLNKISGSHEYHHVWGANKRMCFDMFTIRSNIGITSLCSRRSSVSYVDP